MLRRIVGCRNPDRAVGGAILGGSIIGIILYAALLLYAWEITIRITALVSVALILAILAWIGYTMATTPPTEPIAGIPERGTPSGEAKVETKIKGQQLFFRGRQFGTLPLRRRSRGRRFSALFSWPFSVVPITASIVSSSSFSFTQPEPPFSIVRGLSSLSRQGQ